MNKIILPADEGRSTVILNREDYLEKCMDHINNGPYQLLEKDPTTKIKAKTLKQLKVLKDNEFIDNKLYYYLLTHLRLDFMVHQKYTSQEFLYVLFFHTVAPRGTILTNTWLTFWKFMLKMKLTTPWILPSFPTTSGIFPLKMTRQWYHWATLPCTLTFL